MINNKASDGQRDLQGDNTQGSFERMNKALKAALETPPRKHADEPKRGVAKKIKSRERADQAGKA